MDYALKLQKVCKQYNGSDFALEKLHLPYQLVQL